MPLLAPIDQSLLSAVKQLTVHSDQSQFIGDLASTLTKISASFTGHVIFHKNRPAGFFIIDIDYPKQYDFAHQSSVGLRSFFIAKEFQGIGLARRALQELPTYLKSVDINTNSIFLTVNCRNIAAANLYRQCGFKDNGNLYLGGTKGPQHIMQLSVT